MIRVHAPTVRCRWNRSLGGSASGTEGVHGSCRAAHAASGVLFTVSVQYSVRLTVVVRFTALGFNFHCQHATHVTKVKRQNDDDNNAHPARTRDETER